MTPEINVLSEIQRSDLFSLVTEHFFHDGENNRWLAVVKGANTGMEYIFQSDGIRYWCLDTELFRAYISAREFQVFWDYVCGIENKEKRDDDDDQYDYEEKQSPQGKLFD